MPLITPAVLRDIQQIVEDHHGAVAAVLYGPDAVSPAGWELAVKLGLVDPAKTAQENLASLLHLFGAVAGQWEHAHEMPHTTSPLASMGLDEFKTYLEKHRVPQTALEAASGLQMRMAGAENVRGLGNRVSQTVSGSVIRVDAKLEAFMRSVIKGTIAAKYGDADAQERLVQLGDAVGLPEGFMQDRFRETVREVMSDIGHLTGDWKRDLQRIAQTETHTITQEAIKERWEAAELADAKRQGRPPNDVLVYKIPRPGACQHCIRLHLDGDVPRIYRLAAVSGNSNVGVKAAAWQFVVGSVHPWCACALMKVPSFVEMPIGWMSGDSAPDVIGPEGRLVDHAEDDDDPEDT